MGGWYGPTSWDPFRGFRQEVGRLLAPGVWRLPRGVPPVNLYEVGDQFVVMTSLPGLGPDEVELSVAGETLTIRGERQRPAGVAEESYRRQERSFGQWTRTVTLPDPIESSRIVATFAYGVLTVTIPKAEPLQPRRISVSASVREPTPTEV